MISVRQRYDISFKFIVPQYHSFCKYFFVKEMMYMWIYTPYIMVKGRRIYASAYGLKVFRFWVEKNKIN